MPESKTTDPQLVDDAHGRAAEAFAERARAACGEELEGLYVFGSTISGEAADLSSDVDVLVVLADGKRETAADRLRDLAYDVMIEYGPVVELHVLSVSTFEQYQREGNPFVERVISEGRVYA
ncbi:nucleotidyltransferase domain-containing protein [Halobaculum sp. MBLA0147]|uniref:nucleotidyltransferase domain-containing protein n=1 Tax=Halobaculum sp. MBLA0147 TaxID=3079934 RepID=UPI00352321DD